MTNYHIWPTWSPSFVTEVNWTIAQLRKHLTTQSFTVYSHGTCVISQSRKVLTSAESDERLRLVISGSPDFKVRSSAEGDYLVTFRGAIGGILSGELLKKHLAMLRQEAYTLGRLPGEAFQADRHDESEEMDLIAGLYVRAQMYRDAKELLIAEVVTA